LNLDYVLISTSSPRGYILHLLCRVLLRDTTPSSSSHILSEHIDKVIHLVACVETASRRMHAGVVGNQRLLMTSLVKDLVAVDLEVVLSGLKHRTEHSADLGVKELTREVDYVFWDAIS
jgi:hypothetical protein